MPAGGSRPLHHKSDVGGVVLDLETPEAVQTAARAMRARVCQLLPEARVTGFTVQRMPDGLAPTNS